MGDALRIGSLFSGIGGLELGVMSALADLGVAAEVSWQAEKDPYARAVLAKHWPQVHRYQDVRDVDEHAPPCDLVCGGFPCQDLSIAGKRVGLDGARSGLWSEFVRVIRVLRPRIVVVENVPELLAHLGRVLGPLAALGYDATWDVFSAAEVGAPHLRERLFILAHANGDRIGDEVEQVSLAERSSAARAGDDGGARPVADAEGQRPRYRQPSEGDAGEGRGRGASTRSGPARPRSRKVSNADGVRLAGGLAGGLAAEIATAPRSVLADPDGARQLQPTIAGDDVELRAGDRGEAVADALPPRRPRSAERAHNGRHGPADRGASLGDAEGERRDAARRDAGQGGQPAAADDAGRWWEVEPDVGRVVDGSSSRLDARRRRARLRCLGNGVVQQTARLAVLTLAARAGLAGGTA